MPLCPSKLLLQGIIDSRRASIGVMFLVLWFILILGLRSGGVWLSQNKAYSYMHNTVLLKGCIFIV